MSIELINIKVIRISHFKSIKVVGLGYLLIKPVKEREMFTTSTCLLTEQKTAVRTSNDLVVVG